MPPSFFSPDTTWTGTQILLSEQHCARRRLLSSRARRLSGPSGADDAAIVPGDPQHGGAGNGGAAVREMGRAPSSPGCCTPTNRVRQSGVKVRPVISQATGPVRKRRTSPLAGSAHSIWLLPMPANCFSLE